jgi:hypothetical protein
MPASGALNDRITLGNKQSLLEALRAYIAVKREAAKFGQIAPNQRIFVEAKRRLSLSHPQLMYEVVKKI